MTVTADAGRRPTGVTIVVAIGLVQALLVTVIGIALIVARNQGEVIEGIDASPAVLLGAGIGVVVVGLLGGALALMLGRGVDVVRSIYGIFNTVEVAAAVYALVAERDLRAGSVWALLFPVAILWLLYGSEPTRDWFDR